MVSMRSYFHGAGLKPPGRRCDQITAMFAMGWQDD